MKLFKSDFECVNQLVVAADHRLIACGFIQSEDMHRPVSVVRMSLTDDSQTETLLSFPEKALAVIDPSGACVAAVVFRSNDGNHLHIFSSTPASASQTVKVDVPLSEISSLALSSGGKFLAAIGKPSNFSFRLATRALIVRNVVQGFDSLNASTDDPIEEVAISPDGRRLAVTERSGVNLRIFDQQAERNPIDLDQHDCRRMLFSPGDSFFAAAGRRVDVWDAESRQHVGQFRGQDEDVPDMAFSPDERILAVARTDGAVEFWDFRNSRLVRSYSWDIGRLSAIAFAPDGLTCAVAGQAGRIVVWDVDER